MTSADIRSTFLDFFRSKQHTIVPSASLMPTAPNLLFTNAGMNQFVPYFLGDRAAPWKRVADTQKCIRAGGKHNDLEDVGFDTYHHTLFEMLGNWSFGDYFKRESLSWGWDLLTRVWGMPAKRLFATVYSPAPGDPASFDDEAHAIWTDLFRRSGLDPDLHIISGNKKDNFWMMGDTGPCGPCSEIHFNLLPSDDEKEGRALVNASSPRCIEIWNHVFIQFNANADGTFSPLAAKHVDTGMGFERVAGIHATTAGFKDFSAEPSNYNADVFAPSFQAIAALSGRRYSGTVPASRVNLTEAEQTDVAFRVLADHSRCVACAIADGILPGNADRNYVIRRILRRGLMYGRKNLGLATGFFEKLVDPVVTALGPVFPELRTQRTIIERVIRGEEESFGRTLDRGLQRIEAHLKSAKDVSVVPGEVAFELYDTYGFPVDMTQVLAAERGMTVDLGVFEAEMEKQRALGRSSQKKEVIIGATEGRTSTDATLFNGYTLDPAHGAHSTLVDIVRDPKGTFLVFDETPFYAEMGGQVGDAGHALIDGVEISVIDCVKDRNGRHLHRLADDTPPQRISKLRPGQPATLQVDRERRKAVSRHHSAAHLVHWALRKILGTHVRQFGTHKTPDRLRFDFTHFEALTPAQVKECEQLINARILENAPVNTFEIEFDRKPDDVLAFFGDKYGKYVRVVDIGGFSRELCGGTHVSATGEIGLIKIVAEMAIAAGTRRIEAVAGQAAFDFVAAEESVLRAVNSRLNAGIQDVAEKLESLLVHQRELEKKLRAHEARQSAGLAEDLVKQAVQRDGIRRISAVVSAESPEALRSLGAQALAKLGEGIVVLGSAFGEKASVVAFCSPAAIKAGHTAGKLVAELSAKIGGKGGGKADFAMGGGREPAKLAEALAG